MFTKRNAECLLLSSQCHWRSVTAALFCWSFPLVFALPNPFQRKTLFFLGLWFSIVFFFVFSPHFSFVFLKKKWLCHNDSWNGKWYLHLKFVYAHVKMSGFCIVFLNEIGVLKVVYFDFLIHRYRRKKTPKVDEK